MASTSGPAAHALALQLQEEGPRFDFFAAVRRVECANPQSPEIGTSVKPKDDPVRFCCEAHLAFPTSTLARVTPDANTNAPRIYVNFFGLLGPNSPMPLHITEYAYTRILHHNDPTVARFLDVFHHRLISMFYRAWAIHQPTVSHEHADNDRLARYVASLFGNGQESSDDRDSVPDGSKLHYAGRLSAAARNAEGLESILQDFFQIKTRVDTFVGEWIDVPADSHCRLGQSRMTGTLGSTVIVGSRIWECQYKFRIIMGPMGYADYQRMLPGGASLRRLVDWVKNYLGDELAWDVQLILKKEEVPAAQLGRSGLLGWSTWTKAKPLARDADNLILNPLSPANASRN